MRGNLSEDHLKTKESADQYNDNIDPAQLAMLRWLRRLVTGLALVMGLGMVVIAVVIWLRLGPGSQAAPLQLPEGLTLPAGEDPAAVTLARNWIIIVTQSDAVLVYDRDGVLRQRLRLD